MTATYRIQINIGAVTGQIEQNRHAALEAAALEGPSASPPGRAEDGTELACASDTGVLFRIPVRIKAAATATTRTMAAAS